MIATRSRWTDPRMFAAGPTAECIARASDSGVLFAERALPILALTHAAEVDDRRAGRAVDGLHARHRRRVDGTTLAVRRKPHPPDVTAPLQHVRQRRCTEHSNGSPRSKSHRPEMDTGQVDRRRLPVGSGYWSGRVGSKLGDRCVTRRPHKMQKDTFSSTNLKLRFIYYKVCDFFID